MRGVLRIVTTALGGVLGYLLMLNTAVATSARPSCCLQLLSALLLLVRRLGSSSSSSL